jgi:hypothetical protein
VSKTPFRRSGVDSAVSCGPSRPRGGRDGVILLGCSLSARARRYVLLVSRARDEVTTVKSLDNRVGSDGARATEAERTPLTQFRCVECAFAAARRAPERCPMCGGIVWEDEAWRPFSKRARPPWE